MRISNGNPNKFSVLAIHMNLLWQLRSQLRLSHIHSHFKYLSIFHIQCQVLIAA